jgi:hypothetical protein
VADAADSAALQAGIEFGFAPLEQGGQRAGVQSVTRREIGVADCGKTIPGAAELAVIAAVDAVAYQRPQFFRDGTGKFDCQVGDTAPRIDFIGRDDGAGRAGVNAGRATADSVCFPRHAVPAWRANSTSMTGAESEKAR